MPQNFWNNPSVEPKRNFRFLLSISAFPDATWLVKTAERPKANVSSVPHQYINHTFNYPGRLVWNPISITMVDPYEPVDSTKTIYQFLKIAGYQKPQGTADESFARSQSALLKASATNGLGIVRLSSLHPIAGDGMDSLPADEWELRNAFIQGEVNFGSFDYGSEELLTITFTLQYDWAILGVSGPLGLG